MLDTFAHEMDLTQSRMDGVLRKMAKVSHMTSGEFSGGGSLGGGGGCVEAWGGTASLMTSDPLTPRPPTVVCNCGAVGGASPGSHPALLSLILALPGG